MTGAPLPDGPILRLRVAAADATGWLAAAFEALRNAGYRVMLEFAAEASGRPLALRAALDVERRLYGPTTALAPFLPLDDALPAPGSETSSTAHRIAFTAAVKPGELALFADGEPGLPAVWSALLAGRSPVLEWRDGNGAPRATGRAAIERPDRLGAAFADATARAVTLLLAALAERPPLALPDPETHRGAGTNPLAFVARGLIGRLRRRLPARAGGLPRYEHWRVGIRRLDRPECLPEAADFSSFRWLPDDGGRYYADPILWEEEGRDYLFVEEFPYATGKGLLSVVELAPDGSALGTPRPVLERAGHLSYPFLFRHAGATYLAPENAAEGHVPLYRARRFPDEWDEVPPLAAAALHDATPVEFGGTHWLLANEAREGGSSWDCLCLWRADTPLGTYRPAGAHPLVVDCRHARSAGPVFRLGEHLVRPVQDCDGGYGARLRFMAIERLDEGGFVQRPLGRFEAPSDSGYVGLHTYSRSARFEAIDALGARPS